MIKKILTPFFLSASLFWSVCSVQPEVSIPDYSEVRIKKLPLGMQAWTFRKFSFFETLEKVKELNLRYLEAYPGQVVNKDNPDLKFDHNLDQDQIELIKQKLKEFGISVVNYGVVGFENNESSMRQVFEFAKVMGIRTIVTEPKFEDYSLIEKMVKEYNIRVAIHNHPEPTKYARPETVLEHIEGLDNRIGACVDVSHWLRSGVNVLEGLRMLKGHIIAIHLEDLDVFGSMEARTVPFGQGKVNVHDMLAELTLQNFDGILAIEHEQEDEAYNPSPSIRKGLNYIKSITYYLDHVQILKFSNGRYSKHGWNHYGPGYFELDEKTGILKSFGGMGLFWYGEKQFGDFILEMDYKCSHRITNSGVFLRIKDVPVNNQYIYHSFEIQIYDAAGKGIYKTAAVYDAEAPSVDVFKPTGEWNHFKITFKGNNIQVELNGSNAIDWEVEPRGKVVDFANRGYIGLQNHDRYTSVYFKDIFIKELD